MCGHTKSSETEDSYAEAEEGLHWGTGPSYVIHKGMDGLQQVAVTAELLDVLEDADLLVVEDVVDQYDKWFGVTYVLLV